MGTDVYYLHENGDLKCKPSTSGSDIADMRESKFVKHLWFLDASDREAAWSMLVEAMASGASKDCINGLADRWECNDADAEIYAERVGIRLYRDGNAWCATRSDFENIQESPCGFCEESALGAMAELCRELGFKACTMWGSSFKQLAA